MHDTSGFTRVIAGDTASGGEIAQMLVDHGMSPQIPVWDKLAPSDRTFSRADFIFDRERNI